MFLCQSPEKGSKGYLVCVRNCCGCQGPRDEKGKLTAFEDGTTEINVQTLLVLGAIQLPFNSPIFPYYQSLFIPEIFCVKLYFVPIICM